MKASKLRRALFLLFLIQELVTFLRSTPEERTQSPLPPYPVIFGVCILAPLFFKASLPRWVERLALVLQLLGSSLELAAMFQLARQGSFGIHPTAATKPQQNGLYRLEHPIYCGILLNVLGWTLPAPPAMLATLLLYMGLNRAVQQERVHLASLGVRHRGSDSFLWADIQ